MASVPMQQYLDDAGLNRQHVFALEQLPTEVRAPLELQPHERQLILLAHAGRRLWQRVQAQPGAEAIAHPIDTYSVDVTRRWLAQALPGARHRIVYPNGLPTGRHVALQRLGGLAGWHHATPFMLGIDAHYGSWFAYRVAIITDTALPPTPPRQGSHPCLGCSAKPCISSCPAQALASGTLDAMSCQRHRLQPDSVCALDCPARTACPVGAGHRYDSSQIRHGARASLAALQRLAAEREA